MRPAACLVVLLATVGCRGREASAPRAAPAAPRPSILLVTLDTTRADAIGPQAADVETPAFDALAARGRRFRRAYATAPETLPSHSSMFTGLYPAGHGIHENGRTLAASTPVVAERLQEAGYDTAAFVSSFVLARRFGLARGFSVYDDALPGRASERSARETTDAALAWLAQPANKPRFLWVHYFDPHHPYAPPEPFRVRYARSPYHGEVAAMDEQLGRLVEAFQEAAGGPVGVVVAGDHGEGLGDHGEAQHGRLLYEATMRVPLVVSGPGVPPDVAEAPVSVRRVFHTLLDLAGIDAAGSLRAAPAEIVLGEAMKPFLAYGWQPQVMAVDGTRKAIRAGRPEVYDLGVDPGETQDVSASTVLPRPVRDALREYPTPALGAPPAAQAIDEEAQRRLASLGYVGAAAAPVVRADAPRPVDMAHLFGAMDRASDLFVRADYQGAVPLLERILAADPHNLDAALRLATAFSSLGQDRRARAAFERAEAIAPGSPDVRVYRALHLARGRDWARAVPVLERAVAEEPGRLPALEALAALRQRQGRLADAAALRQRVHTLREASDAELVALGRLAMEAGDTALALRSFEEARHRQGAAFGHDLELGVLYLDGRRLEDARDALDRVPASHPEYAMALFKRAQVSVLLGEPDQAARIEAARRRADAVTLPLIERERLFEGR